MLTGKMTCLMQGLGTGGWVWQAVGKLFMSIQLYNGSQETYLLFTSVALYPTCPIKVSLTLI